MVEKWDPVLRSRDHRDFWDPGASSTSGSLGASDTVGIRDLRTLGILPLSREIQDLKYSTVVLNLL